VTPSEQLRHYRTSSNSIVHDRGILGFAAPCDVRLVHGEAMSILPTIKNCLRAIAALAVRVRSAITPTLSSTSQQTETSMTDPQTTDATSQTANTDAATDAAPAQAETQEPRDLDFVFEQYEAALVDFKDKLDQANAAKATAISAAQRVADLKKELDTLEGDVEKSFASVEAFLASA
jgi:hypothetical protein